MTLNGVACSGIIDYCEHTINLDSSSQDKQGLEQSLLHEIVHGVLNYMSCHELNEDELFVDNLSKSIHQLLKDNPSVFGGENNG